jgi:hypothetical protein
VKEANDMENNKNVKSPSDNSEIATSPAGLAAPRTEALKPAFVVAPPNAPPAVKPEPAAEPAKGDSAADNPVPGSKPVPPEPVTPVAVADRDKPAADSSAAPEP